MEHHEYLISDLDELKVLTRRFASCLTIGDIICLEGEMGVGKTAFAKYLIAALMEANDNEAIESIVATVSSPTFNIVHTYGPPPIWHFDLYRIHTIEEVYELGLEEAIACGITIIEWPQIAYPLLPPSLIMLQFSFGATLTERKIRILKKVM